MIRTIAVIGSTGQLGKPVTRQLMQNGFTVRVLVRNPERSIKELRGKAQLIKGDLRNPGDV